MKEKKKKFFEDDRQVFAKGLCFDKLFLIFVIGSVIGVYYEQILGFIKAFFRDGTIFWESRRGLIYGPFNPLYGVAIAAITYILLKKKRSNLETFAMGSFLGGGIEYFACLFQELFMGTVSWDYSKKFLNIGGRTTIPFMLIWGLLSLLFVKFVYPYFSKMIEKIPYYIGKVLVFSLIIFFTFDIIISCGAVFRQRLRVSGVKPLTFIGEFFDEYYPDDLLKKHYPNMKRK